MRLVHRHPMGGRPLAARTRAGRLLASGCLILGLLVLISLLQARGGGSLASAATTTATAPSAPAAAAAAAATTTTTTIAAASGARKSRCPAARDLEMDACASRMGFLGDHSFVVPKNASALGAFCGSLKENIGCIQSYSRDCLAGFTKQILNSFLKRGRQQQGAICNSGQGRAEFHAKLTPCLPDDKILQFHRCMDASIARFEFIASKQVAPENRLPTLCCSYQIFFRDVEETLGRLCGPGQTGNPATGPAPNYSDTLKYIQKQISGTTGEFVQLVCDNHRSLEECRASSKTRGALKQLEQITRDAHLGRTKTKNRSLLPPLLEILDSGPEH